MSGQLMVNIGYGMIIGSVALFLVLNVIFTITRKRMINKIYNEIENNK